MPARSRICQNGSELHVPVFIHTIPCRVQIAPMARIVTAATVATTPLLNATSRRSTLVKVDPASSLRPRRQRWQSVGNDAARPSYTSFKAPRALFKAPRAIDPSFSDLTCDAVVVGAGAGSDALFRQGR